MSASSDIGEPCAGVWWWRSGRDRDGQWLVRVRASEDLEQWALCGIDSTILEGGDDVIRCRDRTQWARRGIRPATVREEASIRASSPSQPGSAVVVVAREEQ